MARKLTPKQEKFARAYVETGKASDAYRAAYNTDNMKPETIKRKAHDVVHTPCVREYIERLKEEHRERHGVTVDTLTAEAMVALEIGKRSERPQDILKAVEVLAKLHGLYQDRGKLEVSHRRVEEMSDEELMEIIRQARH